LLLLLAGGGGAAWYFLMGPGAEHPEATPGEEGSEEAAKAKEKEDKEKDKKVVFVPLEPFTVNLQGEGDHYLQITIVLEVAEESVTDAIKLKMPLIRNRLLLLLSSKSPPDLNTLEGKQKLANEILAEVRQPLPGKTDDRGVKSVLFNSLIIQ